MFYYEVVQIGDTVRLFGPLDGEFRCAQHEGRRVWAQVIHGRVMAAFFEGEIIVGPTKLLCESSPQATQTRYQERASLYRHLVVEHQSGRLISNGTSDMVVQGQGPGEDMEKNKEHVWQFGHGEVVVAINKKEKTLTLQRVAPGRKFEVAAEIAKDDVASHDESRAPVVMQFANLESLQVLIEGLGRVESSFMREQADAHDAEEKRVDEEISNSIQSIKKFL